jgi:WD40 repeat protein
VAYSHDGALLAATLGEPKQRGRVVLWDVAQRKQLWSHAETDGVPAVAFSPDARTIAIAVYDHTAKLLETTTGKVLMTFQGHKSFVRAVAFAPDGKTLATGGWDHAIKLWDPATGKEKKTLPWAPERLYSVCYSPGGRWLMAAGDQVTVWDADTGKEVRTVKPYFSPWAVFADETWFLTGGYDGTIRLWNIATGEQRLRLGGIAGVDRLAYSPKARQLAETGFAKDFGLFDFTLEPATPKEAQRIRGLLAKLDDDDYSVRERASKEMRAIGFAAEPELRRVMQESPSAEVRIRCRRVRQQLLTKPRTHCYGHTDQVEALAFAPDGLTLASGSRDGTVRLWNVAEATQVSVLVPESGASPGAKNKGAGKVVVLVDNHPMLKMPFGLDFLPDGSLVVADFEGNRVCKVTPAGKVTVLAGAGSKGHRDGPAATALFNAPHNIAVLPGGDVLVADTLNNCVRRINRAGQVTTFAGAPEAGFAGDGGPARDARFKVLYHVCAAPGGFLVADLGNRRIRAVEKGTIRTVAGNGKRGVPGDGAVAVESQLVDPRAVAPGSDGAFWILERSGHALRFVDAKGLIQTAVGTGKPGPAADGPAMECTLRGPKYIWVEKSGTVLIADTDNHCIRRYSPKSRTLTTVAGTGKQGRGGAGGLPTATALSQPHGVAVDAGGVLYISDSHNRRILKVEP